MQKPAKEVAISDMMSLRTIFQYQWACVPLCIQQSDVIGGHQKEQSLTSRSAVRLPVLQDLADHISSRDLLPALLTSYKPPLC